MGKFVITKRKDGEFQFNLKAGNGEVILTSEGYKTKAGCEGGIESVRKNSPDDARYDKITTSTGKYRFNLEAKNGQIIGTSESYESAAGMNNGIESVKRNGQSETVEDLAV